MNEIPLELIVSKVVSEYEKVRHIPVKVSGSHSFIEILTYKVQDALFYNNPSYRWIDGDTDTTDCTSTGINDDCTFTLCNKYVDYTNLCSNKKYPNLTVRGYNDDK